MCLLYVNMFQFYHRNRLNLKVIVSLGVLGDVEGWKKMC